MTSFPSSFMLADDDFQICYAHSLWGECLDILTSHGLNPLRTVARHSGYPDVMFMIDPVAPEWSFICIARYQRFWSLGAVVGGFLVACGSGLQAVIDEQGEAGLRRQYILAAISELRFQGLLTAPWFEVVGRIIGVCEPTEEELVELASLEEDRCQLLKRSAGRQYAYHLRIRGILNREGYEATLDDGRVIAALAAMACGLELVPSDAHRRQGYIFEVLDIIGLSSRPRHGAWAKVRSELF